MTTVLHSVAPPQDSGEQLRRPTQRPGLETWFPKADRQPVRRCDSCGRQYLYGYDAHTGARANDRRYCRACAYHQPRAGRDRAELADVRSGTWRPTPELAAYMAERGEEIAQCPGCGFVRLKLIGQWCGGAGCQQQTQLF